MPLAAGTRLGPYEILAPLGAGGMGEVYKARDPRLGREVAVKVLPEEFFKSEERERRFQREARLLAALNHPGIAAVYSFEEIPSSSPSFPGTRILVMELLEGETLRDRLRAGPLPLRKAVDVAVQMARALAAAHEKGIVHRDLKPENVFLTKEERVKLLDFGLAKLSRREESAEAETESALTEAGAVFGTVGYMSPEQVRGEPVDHRSDIFSFGTIVYEMLAGRNPFRRETQAETMTGILKDEPTPLSETPSLAPIVARCLEKKPEARFQSAADLAFALLSSSSAPAVSIPDRRWVRVAALALVGCLALAVVLAWSLRSRGGNTAAPEFTRLTFRRGTVMNARFSPDGPAILYSANWEGQPPRAYSTLPGGQEAPIGPPDALFLGASRGGRLAFALRPYWNLSYLGTLATSAGSSEAPRELAKDVRAADWSRDGGSMALVSRDSARSRWRLEYPPGRTVFEGTDEILEARVSTGGREIVFTSTAQYEQHSILIGSPPGQTATLCERWRGIGGVAWSPTGEEVFFTGSKEGRSSTLWAVDRSGRVRSLGAWAGGWTLQDVAPDGRILLTQGRPRTSMMTFEDGRDLTWFDHSVPMGLTPDGKTVLFREWGEGVGGAAVTFVRATDGSPAVRIGEGNPVAISPDGRGIVISRRDPDRLVLVSAGPGGEKTLPAGDLRNYGGDLAYSTAFFPDGRRIVFVAAAAGGSRRLWSQDVREGPPRPFGAAEDLLNPVVSPDGSSVAALFDAENVLVVLSAAGETRRRLDLGAEDSAPIGWFKDNRSVFLRVRSGNDTRIDLLDTVSGARRVWRKLTIQDKAGILRGSFLTFISHDGRTIITSHFRLLNDLYLVKNVR